jgi:hypothetical protein
VWVDGVHFNVRLEDDRLCTLVMIGVRPDGTKELIAVEDGYRESAESWKTVLRDLKRRGMRPPVVAVGDGALGFWAAVRDVWPKTREQRDWFRSRGLRQLSPRFVVFSQASGCVISFSSSSTIVWNTTASSSASEPSCESMPTCTSWSTTRASTSGSPTS